jgi:outer membrane biosynthesis protein TonB
VGEAYPEDMKAHRVKRTRLRRWSTALFALLLALLINPIVFMLMVFSAVWTMQHAPGHLKELADRLMADRKVAEARAEKEKTRGIVVTILPPPEKQEPPKDAKYLAQFDSKVEREQKARARVQPKEKPGGATRGKPAPGQRVATVEKPPAPGPTQEQDTLKPELKPATVHFGPNGRSVLFQRGASGSQPVAASTTAEEMASASRNLGGTDVFVSDDALIGVRATGDKTMLNTRQFRYWDFFQRVRDAVKKQWHPNEVYSRRDPYWTIYQRQNRLTVLRVSLDKEGNVEALARVRRSGLDFLDEEAVRAFSSAGPFVNPPRGLVDESGRIVFDFGFYLELTD